VDAELRYHTRMQFISEMLSAVGRLLIKLALLIVGAVIMLVLLCVGALTVLWVVLKALITGRKPELTTSFVSFRQFRHTTWTQRDTDGGDQTAPGEIIEGQAVEVRDDTALPDSTDRDQHKK